VISVAKKFVRGQNGSSEGQKKLRKDHPLSTSKLVPIHASGPWSIVQLGGTATIKSIVASAGQQAFPGVDFSQRSQLEESVHGDASARGAALLVMTDPNPSTLAQARDQLDEMGLPRWAMVVLGDGVAGDHADLVDVIPEAETNLSELARVFRSAWERHELRRENLRLRGDLMTFGSRIAHDLRTPLGGILTTTEMLREVLAEDAPADVPLTQPILDSTDGLVKLIERTSFFARARASHEPRRVLDMGTPFWNAYQHLERVLLKAQVSFTHPQAWPKVDGHQSWLEMVWSILLGNAVQHSATGARIEAGWSKVVNGHRFWMRSEGTILPAKRAMLFFPFHRLHETGAPRGLGLPVMRGLVEAEGGWCGFEDVPDGRLEFFFVLPESSQSSNIPDLPHSAM
jgi:signal transduction histidine kinase